MIENEPPSMPAQPPEPPPPTNLDALAAACRELIRDADVAGIILLVDSRQNRAAFGYQLDPSWAAVRMTASGVELKAARKDDSEEARAAQKALAERTTQIFAGLHDLASRAADTMANVLKALGAQFNILHQSGAIDPSAPTYLILRGGRAIMCLVCQKTSYHPADVKALYCGNCQRFHLA